MCVCGFVCACVCECVYVCVYIFMCVCGCVCVWVCDVCMCLRVCGVFVYMCVCVCLGVCGFVFVCGFLMCVYVCVYIGFVVCVCGLCMCLCVCVLCVYRFVMCVYVCVCFLCCVYVCMCFGVCVCGCVLCVFMCVCLYFCVCHSSVSHLVCATFFFLYFCNSFLILTLLDLEIKSHFFYLNDSIPLCTCNLIIVMWRLFTTYKTVLILQLFKLGYLFRPLHGHHQANKEIVLIKVHSNLFFFLFFAGTQKSLIEINKEIARGVSILN